jgi:uncharacterized membrane protein
MSYYVQNPICRCLRCRMYRMTLPLLMVAFGVLFLIDNVTGISGGIYVSVGLIVFGAIRLIQFSASTVGHRAPGEIPSGEIPPVPTNVAAAAETERQVNHG